MTSLFSTSTIRPSAKAINIYELFAGKVFRVPNYQRAFAWDLNNLDEFWNDIKDGIATKTEHYWGTITLKLTNESVYEKDTPFNIYEIVDGQQRITTLYLFLLALSKMGKPAIKDNFIKWGNVYRLELGGLNSQFLKDLVDDKDPAPNIKTNRLLKGALEYFKSQLNSFVSKPADLDTISDYVQRVTFSLEFVIQDETLAVKAFESLNDRGKALTLLDKTKSFLMFYSLRYVKNVFGHAINTVFGNVFMNYDVIKEVGEKEGIDYIRGRQFSEDEVLRFFYHYFAYYAKNKYSLPIAYDYDVTAEEVFEQFLKKSCKHLKDEPAKLESFIKELLESLQGFVESFKKIVNRTQENCQYKKMLSFLGLNTRLYPLLVSLECENILNQQMLSIIETADVRVYKIRGTEPRAELYRNTVSQIKTRPDPAQIYKSINDFIGIFMPDHTFQSYLTQTLYGNPAAKYILWEFEKYGDSSFNDCDYAGYKDVQMDHIFPDEVTISFPAHDFQDLTDYYSNIHKMGNLTLLEEKLNKSARNRAPQSKVDYYKRSNVPGTKKLGFQIGNQDFNKNDVEKRTQEIADFCVQRWKINP